jgi:hypothetical protein
MAQIVVGMGTSHSPILSMQPESWTISAEFDQKPGRELMSPRSGKLMSYPELLAEADPAIAGMVGVEAFKRQYAACQRGIETLAETLKAARPDVAIVIGSDQEELFFDDNMPAFSVYWGDTWDLKPWTLPDYLPEAFRVSMWGYGEWEQTCRIDSAFAEEMIRSLVTDDFDISLVRHPRDLYGGSVGPSGYLNMRRETKPRPHGMGHAWAFVVTRLMRETYIPFVPLMINTCYPPNQPSALRCYRLGQAVRRAVERSPSAKRVAIIASGGLSHFVVDEELDRMAFDAMARRDPDAIARLPEFRLQSAASEIKNWLCAAGALEGLAMDIVEYVPGRRTPAGTGGGWGFVQWR